MLWLLLIAAPMKIAVSPLQAGEGISEKTAATLTEALTAEMRKRQVGTVITHDEIQSLLSLEEQKQMVGCSSSACIAEIGGALGVDHLVQGSVAKLGDSWLLFVKLFDVKRATVKRSADKALKAPKADALLDALPQLVSTLFEGAAPAPSLPTQAVVSARDIPLTDPPALTFYTDKKGHYAAAADQRLFYGTDKALYEQRMDGGGKNGEQRYFTFWEPIHRDGTNRSFRHDGNTGTLTCGETFVIFTKTTAPTGVKYFQVRWQRTAVFLGMSDTGSYFYIDAALGEAKDYRLYIGKKGSMTGPIEAESANGSTFATDQGTLVWDRANQTATFQGSNKISVIDTWGQGALIYGKLGVYEGQRRASPCE